MKHGGLPIQVWAERTTDVLSLHAPLLFWSHDSTSDDVSFCSALSSNGVLIWLLRGSSSMCIHDRSWQEVE